MIFGLPGVIDRLKEYEPGVVAPLPVFVTTGIAGKVILPLNVLLLLTATLSTCLDGVPVTLPSASLGVPDGRLGTVFGVVVGAKKTGPTACL